MNRFLFSIKINVGKFFDCSVKEKKHPFPLKEWLWASFWLCWKLCRCPQLQEKCIRGHMYPQGTSPPLLPQRGGLIRYLVVVAQWRGESPWGVTLRWQGGLCKVAWDPAAKAAFWEECSCLYNTVVAICLNHARPGYFLGTENPNTVQPFRSAGLGFLHTHPGPSGLPYRPGMQQKQPQFSLSAEGLD